MDVSRLLLKKYEFHFGETWYFSESCLIEAAATHGVTKEGTTLLYLSNDLEIHSLFFMFELY
jgi:hypothetical protein